MRDRDLRLQWSLAALVSTAAMVLAPAGVGAQPVPLGDEFIVNTYTTYSQQMPRLSAAADGRFVVVWTHRVDNSNDWSVHGQRFDAAAQANGTEFQISQGSLTAYSPTVSMADDGSFLVAWFDHTPRIMARAYDSVGLPVGDAFRADTTIFDYDHGYPHGYHDRKSDPDVAAGAAGQFLIVWGAGYNEYLYRVHARRKIRGQVVDGGGSFVGSELTVGGDLYYKALAPNAERDAQGSFVVAWNQVSSYDYENYDYYYAIPNWSARGRRLDAGGAAAGSAITVGSSSETRPGVATKQTGGFILAWASSEQDAHDVVARVYDSQGSPSSTEFQVSEASGPMGGPANAGSEGVDVAAAEGGGFVVAWASGGTAYGGGNDGDELGIFARSYSADGTPLGTEIQVNTYTTGTQARPVIVPVGADSFVVAWESVGQDGSSAAVVARKFARAPACGDASADGVNTATDALIALATAVGAGTCPACVCDANGAGGITATDALIILRDVTGQAVSLACAAC